MSVGEEVGRRQGKLVVVERLPNSRYRCRCDCGGERIVHVGHFNAYQPQSCGCLWRHGHGGSNRSRTYISYHNMMARCHKTANKRYADYGGKGIVVCERWQESFANFLSDMGECPKGYTIDRIDNRMGYEPGNCRWASRQENQRNRSISVRWIVHGREFDAPEDAGRVFGVAGATIRQWCKGRTSQGRYYAPKNGCWVVPRYEDAA